MDTEDSPLPPIKRDTPGQAAAADTQADDKNRDVAESGMSDTDSTLTVQQPSEDDNEDEDPGGRVTVGAHYKHMDAMENVPQLI